MSALSNSPRASAAPTFPSAPRTVIVARAVAALAWAAALIAVLQHHVLTAHSDLPVLAAALLATYPAIDVIASLLGARAGATRPRPLLINAGISAAAVLAVALTAFGDDVSGALIAFGAWASVSGAALLVMATRQARAGHRQISMIVSGGLSTAAGLMFIATAGSHSAHVKNLAGYMALGAVLFLISAVGVGRGPVNSSSRGPQARG